MDRTRSTSSGGTFVGSATESEFPSITNKRLPGRATPSPSPTSALHPSANSYGPPRPASANSAAPAAPAPTLERRKFNSFESQRMEPRAPAHLQGVPINFSKTNVARELRHVVTSTPQQQQQQQQQQQSKPRLIAEEKPRARGGAGTQQPQVNPGTEPTPTPSERSAADGGSRFGGGRGLGPGDEKGRWSKRVSRRARFSLAAVGVPYIERPGRARVDDEDDYDYDGSDGGPRGGEVEGGDGVVLRRGLLATTTPTSTAPTSTTTGFLVSTQPASEPLSCPKSDRRAYPVPDTDKSFLVFCAIDYTEGTQELGEVRAASMEECVGSCAELAACQGCGWGFIEGDKDEKFRCWLKGTIGLKHVARANWTFALLQQE
ncbi:unnamed protein product [Parascedosporium putredinis]|uniref:Apple domain-containing protein n=1 Tax=Parascedosporium putredinis TaxID=1442378 RepID=A0A9P1H2Q1_9PEZI|nr:unnamed protein product [Parascedosporium putredinis]CAI7994249.1 unnamed protein product [Parascedosporium putredinis]